LPGSWLNVGNWLCPSVGLAVKGLIFGKKLLRLNLFGKTWGVAIGAAAFTVEMGMF
jgi:hypothetical protein